MNFADLLALAKNYNQGLGAAPVVPGATAAFNADVAAAFAAVPERGGAGLLALGALHLSRRQGRRRWRR